MRVICDTYLSRVRWVLHDPMKDVLYIPRIYYKKQQQQQPAVRPTKFVETHVATQPVRDIYFDTLSRIEGVQNLTDSCVEKHY